MGQFQVLFSGQVVEGANVGTVRNNIARRLGLDENKVAQLFSGRTVVIRSELSRDDADRLQAELAALGALARIKDLTPDERARFKIDRKLADHTLKDITAAHVECARCGHLQLESEFCARCGVDMAMAQKLKRKEDLLIEKKIRSLKGQQPSAGDAGEAPVKPANDPIIPIKRRLPHEHRRAAPRNPVSREGLPPRGDSAAARPTAKPANPFSGGFWRSLLKSGRRELE